LFFPLTGFAKPNTIPMPFEIHKQAFGDLTEFVIQHTTTGNRFVVVPELGGIVRQLSLKKGNTLFSVLKTPGTPDTLKADTQSASELLFPFASRIPEGTYTFFQKTYSLVQNDPNHASAIHGLVRKQAFHLSEQIVRDDAATLTLHYKLRDQIGYPFSIDFAIQYRLTADGKFELTYSASNTGNEPAPAMFGWHPYFKLGNEQVDAWKIEIPSQEIVKFNDDMTPIGKEAFPISGPTLLFKKVLDNCFIVNTASEKSVTKLISENQDVTLNIEQETGEGKFNHLVIYTPPSRDCVAIEPLTANVNAFNNGEGLNVLAPGNMISGTISISLS
jgi:aldose 1-epimerase